MLFVYETIHGMAMIIDSSFQGVRFRPVSWYDLADDGYTAIRYSNIVENGDPSGSILNPIELPVGEFDHSIDGNTRDVVSLEFNSYSIAPSSRQPGPEVIYELNIQEEGFLEASITQFKDEGIDNDIHLLESFEKDAQGMALGCVARGDDRIEVSVSDGKYYIVIDGRNNSPGEYTLTVRYRKSINAPD